MRSSARRQPKQERAQRTVEAVLDAVTRVLKRRGPAGVNTNAIARIAGISIGSLYQYFPDKHAIFAALRDRHEDAMASLVEAQLLASADGSLRDALQALLSAMIDAHALDPALYVLLFEQVPQAPAAERALEQRVQRALRLALAARAHELRQPKDLERVLFVTGQLLEALAHGVVLRRPDTLSLAEAKQEALRALVAYVSTHLRRSQAS